jgi:uncharacterized protein YeaO (DUF488 family)
VPKTRFASENWYDVWFPNLAPSLATMKLGLAAETPAQWNAFARKYRAEMAASENARMIELLARLSQQTNFSVGCYCEGAQPQLHPVRDRAMVWMMGLIERHLSRSLAVRAQPRY